MHRPGQIYDDDGRVIKLDAAAVAAGQAGAGTDAVADPIAGPSKVADTYAAAGPRGQAPQQAQRAAATMRSIPSNGDASANNRSGVPLVPTTRHGLLNGAANGARVVAVQAENSQSMFDGFVDENASGVTAGNAADDSGYQEGDFSVLDVKPSLVADKIVPIAFGKDWDSATRAGNRATVADGDVRGAASHAAGRPSMGQADGSQAASAPQNRQELQKQVIQQRLRSSLRVHGLHTCLTLSLIFMRPIAFVPSPPDIRPMRDRSSGEPFTTRRLQA